MAAPGIPNAVTPRPRDAVAHVKPSSLAPGVMHRRLRQAAIRRAQARVVLMDAEGEGVTRIPAAAMTSEVRDALQAAYAAGRRNGRGEVLRQLRARLDRVEHSR